METVGGRLNTGDTIIKYTFPLPGYLPPDHLLPKTIENPFLLPLGHLLLTFNSDP